MCVVMGDTCQCKAKTSLTETAMGVLALLAVAAGVAVAGAVFRTLWLPIGIGLVVGWLLAFQGPRRAVWRAAAGLGGGLVWLVRWYLRRRVEAPQPAPAVLGAYRATVYLDRGGRREVAWSGDVGGLWRSAKAVEDAAVALYLAKDPAANARRVSARAEPMAIARR